MLQKWSCVVTRHPAWVTGKFLQIKFLQTKEVKGMYASSAVANYSKLACELGEVEDLKLRYVGADAVEVTAIEKQTGEPVCFLITATTMIELVSACSLLLNSYSAGMLRDLGVL